jgi:hypothetical protein
LVRFYLGAYRYQDEEKESQGARDFMINLFGAIFVFIVLYVAGILIRTTTLFYLALFLIHLVDLAWFLCVMRFLSLGDGLRKVSRQFILLDSLTLAALFAIGILDFFCGPHRIYLYQFASLIVVVAAGIWDFVSLWPFYMNQKDWQHHILFQKRTSH